MNNIPATNKRVYAFLMPLALILLVISITTANEGDIGFAWLTPIGSFGLTAVAKWVRTGRWFV